MVFLRLSYNVIPRTWRHCKKQKARWIFDAWRCEENGVYMASSSRDHATLPSHLWFLQKSNNWHWIRRIYNSQRLEGITYMMVISLLLFTHTCHTHTHEYCLDSEVSNIWCTVFLWCCGEQVLWTIYRTHYDERCFPDPMSLTRVDLRIQFKLMLLYHLVEDLGYLQATNWRRSIFVFWCIML